jgi:hypothetical protein
MSPNGKFDTGDPILDSASDELSRTGNIDVFNNMMVFATDGRMWREIGSPKEITNQLYAQSPLAAAVRNIGRQMANSVSTTASRIFT